MTPRTTAAPPAPPKLPSSEWSTLRNPLREELESLFRQKGARAVIADVNELERVLP